MHFKNPRRGAGKTPSAGHELILFESRRPVGILAKMAEMGQRASATEFPIIFRDFQAVPTISQLSRSGTHQFVPEFGV